jgi:superfamily I DNA/RNA helicase
MLVNTEGEILSRSTVSSFAGVAKELFTLAFGYDPRPANKDHISGILNTAACELGLTEFADRFLVSEWSNVVDAWQIETLEAYQGVPRLGRKNRMGSKQRERVWPAFEKARALLNEQGILSWPSIFGLVTEHYEAHDHKPFTHIVVDESQDLGVPELRMLSALSGKGKNALFFSGDLGQRIFQEPFSWLTLGIDVRGRSSTLKVNYRTSHQIRQTVDRLLPKSVRDVDGNEEDRTGTVSVFNGPDPKVKVYSDPDEEVTSVGLWIYEAIEEGLEPEEIGVFVRSEGQMPRARSVIKEAGQKALELSERVEERNGRISVGTMHLAKGLEFKAVVVMACDDDVLPLQERVETVADESELDEIFETERHLFYVACTRARDQLLVSGVAPASEFFEDMNLGE